MSKTIFRLLTMAMIAILSCQFASCSDDDDDIETADIVGNWYATVNNGKATISLTFNDNKTGYLHYCWDNVRYHTIDYSFTYKISGSTIKTSGTYVDYDDGVSEGSMDFSFSNGKITGGRWSTDNGYTK